MKELSAQPDRHIAEVAIHWDALVEALLPPGTKIEGATFNFINMTVDFVVSHPDLQPVPPAARPPHIDVIVTTTTAVVETTRKWYP